MNISTNPVEHEAGSGPVTPSIVTITAGPWCDFPNVPIAIPNAQVVDDLNAEPQFFTDLRAASRKIVDMAEDAKKQHREGKTRKLP